MNVLNFDDWDIWEGSSEGSGRSEKIWLRSREGVIGLFKFPKSELTTEYVSEHLAYKIGEKLGIATAKIDIGSYNNRIGCMSYLINEENQSIIEGVSLIMGEHPQYDVDRLYDPDNKQYYCIEMIMEFSKKFHFKEIENRLIEMMLFDFLIGNSDRHQSNWGLLIQFSDNTKRKGKGKVGFCPLYDNGSSLCCYVTDEDAKNYLITKDKNRFNSLVNSKSKSIIRIDGYSKTQPRHIDVVHFLLREYEHASEYSNTILSVFTNDVIDELLDEYPEIILSQSKKKLISKFLKRKVEILREVVDEYYSSK